MLSVLYKGNSVSKYDRADVIVNGDDFLENIGSNKTDHVKKKAHMTNINTIRVQVRTRKIDFIRKKRKVFLFLIKNID